MKKALITKEKIVVAAVRVAETVGYANATREQISKKAEVKPATVSHHLGTMPNVRRCIMRRAIKDSNAVVVGQGLADGNIYARKAPAELKDQALNLMRG